MAFAETTTDATNRHNVHYRRPARLARQGAGIGELLCVTARIEHRMAIPMLTEKSNGTAPAILLRSARLCESLWHALRHFSSNSSASR